MTSDVTYEDVRAQVHEAIWRLRGADEFRILVEVERLGRLADRVRDPARRADAHAQVAGFRVRIARPPAGLGGDRDTCLVEPDLPGRNRPTPTADLPRFRADSWC